MKRKTQVSSAAGIALAIAFFVPALTSAAPAPPGATEALFNLDATSRSPLTSPFPSNWFTVPDNTNKTHLRINLPALPECETQVTSNCEDRVVLNELDGFNVLPRLSIPFSGPIDPNTVNSDSVFLVSLGTAGFGGDYMPWGTVIGIDQVVWDPSANILHVISDQLLAQHTRFALIVTRKVLDVDGAPVAASQEFRQFRDATREDYKLALLEAIQAAGQAGVGEQDIVVASVFTTRSITAILEKVRDRIHDRKTPPAPADFVLGLNGERTVFSLDKVTGITWNQQVLTDLSDPTAFNKQPVNLSKFQNVEFVAFGKYLSPDYMVHNTQYISVVGTRSGTPVVQEWKDLYFNLYLPSGTKPLNGWPVAIFVTGINGSKDDKPVDVGFVASMAKHGIATIAINNVGHGFGSESKLSVSLKDVANSIKFPAGGRGIDQSGEGTISNSEGLQASRPRALVVMSDAYRQTAIDLMQLTREIEVGMDVDADGRPDVDASRIYLFGTSLGGGISTVFFAVEPDVRVGVLNVPFDPVPGSILSCVRRNSAAGYLSVRQPSLLNPTGVPRISALDGCLLLGTPRFNDNFPLKYGIPLTVQLTLGTTTTTAVIQSPVTNEVPGALEIQEALENAKWVGQAGSPLAFAPYLRKAPLKRVPPKTVLFEMAKEDQTANNPSDTAIVRAGDLADSTLFFRYDIYRGDHLDQPATNPHTFATDLVNFETTTLGVQDAVGQFFESDGSTIVVPEPRLYFELPIVLPLPESLNYSLIP